MKTGVHVSMMQAALAQADKVCILEATGFDVPTMVKTWQVPVEVFGTTDEMITSLVKITQPGDAILVMSNRGFENLHERLIETMEQARTEVS
jgi:UDP-N-acetylmuramate: L-alanyl-gamma-D-glutamyl-meso-diaminopimelate ligase